MTRVEVAQVSGTPLLDRLLAGDPVLVSLYGGDPRRVEAYAHKLREVTARFDRPARAAAAAALRPTSVRARERLRRFVEEGGAMVTTGQQAGLFTGPLYTVHKALTAVRLAEALEQRLGVVVLPVFWIASEDHDFAEVNHAWAVDTDGALRRSAVRATTSVPVPMSEMALGREVEPVLDGFVQAIARESFEADRLRTILAGYHPGRTLAAAFGDALQLLLSAFDVCIADAAAPELKLSSGAVLAAAAEAAAEHEGRVAGRTADLQELGLAPPVMLVPGATNLFYHGPAGRERLHREGGGVVAREAGTRFTPESLRRAIETDPGRFSPNVLLRPVVESAVFPTLAYVGGPAEVGYFAQIGGLFDAVGIRPPVAFPRFGARVVPAVAEEARRELGISEVELARPEHEILERVARSRLPADVASGLGELRQGLADGFARLADAAGDLDPTLALALGARRNRALLEVAAAERKILRRLKRADAPLARGVRLARSHLRPQGLPQERVLTVFQYLAGSPDLLETLARAMQLRLDGEAVRGVEHDVHGGGAASRLPS